MTLPSGTVTFLFGDVESSTAMLQRLGERYGDELRKLRATVRHAVEGRGGELVDQRGDETFAVFTDAQAAADAAVVIQLAQADEILRIRIGLHTGRPALVDEGYIGLDVHLTARICAAGYGGQVLVSQATASLLDDEANDLGAYLLHGVEEPVRILQLQGRGLAARYPPPRAVAVPTRRHVWDLVPLPSTVSRARAASLDDLAWSARGRAAAAAGAERESASRVAAALAAAAAEVTSARRLLASADRRSLEREQTELSRQKVSTPHGVSALQHVSHRLDVLEALARALRQLNDAARRPVPHAPDLDDATAALRVSLTEARSTLGKDADRVRRTPHRGVYRLGDEFVVLVEDARGVERRQYFRSRREARRFRWALRRSGHARVAVASMSRMTGGELMGGGGDS